MNWHYLPASNEVIWFSERDNWGQLYLYDATTGKLKNQITTGEGNVTQLLRVDEKNRVAVFSGRGQGEGPRSVFHSSSIASDFDGNDLKLLTPEDANHDISLSPSGDYFVDSYSKPDVPPVAVLRDENGQADRARSRKRDISQAAGHRMEAADSVHGEGARRRDRSVRADVQADQSRSAEEISDHQSHLSRARRRAASGSRNFSAARGDCQALAELGFVVVEIDGMGTPWRSKKFHEAYFGNMGDNTLPDQVAGMKQLARALSVDRYRPRRHLRPLGRRLRDRRRDVPLSRFLQGGDFRSRQSRQPRIRRRLGARSGRACWRRNPDGTTNYDNQANQLLAKNLKGHLLLAHGTMDNNVPPYNTLLVVNELIKANKDFDLLLLPNRNHGFGNEPYMMRRRWDYFVRYLLGAEPPQGYEMHAPAN